MPSYGSAYLLAGAAEKQRIEARGEEVEGSAGRKQMRLAWRPASRVREDAIAVKEIERKLDDCNQTSIVCD